MGEKPEIKKDIDYLMKQILDADKAYYLDSKPILSDIEYDRQ